MTKHRVALFEPNNRQRVSLGRGLRQAGLVFTAAEAPEDLTQEDIVVLGPGARGIPRLAKAIRASLPQALVLVARKTGTKVSAADGILPLPLSPADLQVRLPELQKLRAISASRDPEPRPGEGILDPRTGFYTFNHFREVLFIEVKRARRYGFPLALALVAFDPLPPPKIGNEVKEQLYSALALAIRRSLRDTDYPVQYGAERTLLLMPHTDLPGALSVSRRACERVAKSVVTHERRVLRPTVSLGVASADVGGRELSFSDLAKRATHSLEAARAEGGNRVEFYDVAAIAGDAQVKVESEPG